MPLPTIAGVVRGAAAGPILGGGRWSNTWHFRRSDLGTPDSTSIGILHLELVAFYAAFLGGTAPNATALDQIAWTPLDGISGAITLPGPGPTAGSTANSLPPETAEVLTLRTALRGRRARGRIFLPAVGGSSVENGRIILSTIALTLAAVTALRAAAAVSGWELGVASYGRSVKTNYIVTPHVRDVTTWDPFFTPVTDVTMDAMFDVQRSRKN